MTPVPSNTAVLSNCLSMSAWPDKANLSRLLRHGFQPGVLAFRGISSHALRGPVFHDAPRRRALRDAPVAMSNQPFNHMDSTKLTFIEREHPEWNRMWDLLASKNHLLWGVRDNVCFNEQFHESWQYMGTVEKPGQPTVHEFRHRMHPRSNRRELLRIAATPEWFPAMSLQQAHSTGTHTTDIEVGGVLDATGHVHSDADPGL